MPYELRVLGPIELLDPAGSPVPLSLGKPLALLTYVACHTSPISREELAELLWPEADRQRRRQSVRQALFVLRNAIGEDFFGNQDPLALDPGTLQTDLEAFTEALTSGRVAEARRLWRGPALEHFVLAGVRQWNHWTEELRADLDHRFSRALLQHADSVAKAGNVEESLAALGQAIEVAPSFEGPHSARVRLLLSLLRLDTAREALADAHWALGDQPDAMDGLDALEKRLHQLVLEQRSRATEEETFPMEFVGRSRELAGLTGLLKDAQLNRSRVAIVTGPSGIGKTRLARELLAFASLDEAGVVGVGGTRGEMKLRWGAASEVVRQLLRLPGSAGVSSASDSLLRAMLPSLGRNEVNPSTMSGVSPAGILDAVHDLLESVTFEAPLAVFVDDFQWLDPESRTLLLGLAHRCRDLRLLFLFLGRSDLSSRHWEHVEDVLVSESGARRFVLEPLIEEEVGELLALGAAFEDAEHATSIVRKVHRAGAGNPLFIREILRDLHGKGILRREERGWVFHLPDTRKEIEVPENIQALLRERLQKLSEAAATLAAVLAREDRKLSSEVLQKLTQLPEPVFTQAVAELLHRGVIEWTKEGSLDFVHELLREEATERLRKGLPWPVGKDRGRTRSLALLALTAFIALALPLGMLWGHGILPWEKPPVPPRYGGGTIIFQRRSGDLIQFSAQATSPEEWRPTEIPPIPGPDGKTVFRLPSGELLWFGIVDRLDGPDMAVLTPAGMARAIFPLPGDQSLQDLSPDGSRILFVSENIGEDLFSHSLFVGHLGSERAERIYRGHGHVTLARWSPNGDLVAFSAASAEDTLVVTSSQGQRVGYAVLGDITGITWCGSSLVAASSFEDSAFLLKLRVPGMAVDTIAWVEPGARPTCSPDGTALAFVGVEGRRLVPLILDIESGRTHPLPLADGQVHSTAWLPDRPPPIPMAVKVEADTVRLELGEERSLRAVVMYSDGSESTNGIVWESQAPHLASVGPYRELTGNGAGFTQILARWGHSLADTVTAIVEGDGSEWAIFREEFLELDTIKWTPVGSRPPGVGQLAGNPVLKFAGAEKYTDGLLLREPLPLYQGITVEVEFRLRLTRSVHQNLGLCLQDADPEAVDREKGMLTAEKTACIIYPAHELEKLDPSEVVLVTDPGRDIHVRVPEILPSDDWVHLALQVRADGEVSLVLNRRRVATSPVNLRTDPSHQWTLLIQGDAIGTELFVRNLAVWAGERY